MDPQSSKQDGGFAELEHKITASTSQDRGTILTPVVIIPIMNIRILPRIRSRYLNNPNNNNSDQHHLDLPDNSLIKNADTLSTTSTSSSAKTYDALPTSSSRGVGGSYDDSAVNKKKGKKKADNKIKSQKTARRAKAVLQHNENEDKNIHNQKASSKTDENDGNNTLKVKKKKKTGLDEKKQQNLPDTWYYSSNHILVNRERALCGLTQLKRVRLLDELARFHAENMAEKTTLFHSVDGLDALKSKVGEAKFAGENVQRGKSIRWMHTAMMASGKKSRENILSKKYAEFGMGTAKGSDGKLYMVQLFRGGDGSNKKSRRNHFRRLGVGRQ